MISPQPDQEAGTKESLVLMIFVTINGNCHKHTNFSSKKVWSPLKDGDLGKEPKKSLSKNGTCQLGSDLKTPAWKPKPFTLNVANSNLET